MARSHSLQKCKENRGDQQLQQAPAETYTKHLGEEWRLLEQLAPDSTERIKCQVPFRTDFYFMNAIYGRYPEQVYDVESAKGLDKVTTGQEDLEFTRSPLKLTRLEDHVIVDALILLVEADARSDVYWINTHMRITGQNI
ncbi:hypothetical protein Tco_1263605 [Tanacetum coccineum]